MTAGSADMLLSFAEDCYYPKSIRCQVWMCLDTSSVTGQKEFIENHALNVGKSFLLQSSLQIHTYTNNDVLKMFPQLQYARDHGARGWSDRNVGFGFHTEAITYWYATLPENVRNNVKQFWVFEADVGYSGHNITKLMSNYDDKLDYITLDCHDPGGWMHGSASTPEFQQYRHTPTARANVEKFLNERNQLCNKKVLRQDCGKPIRDDKLIVSIEAVQRFSAKMMKEMLQLNTKGIHSWSEQSGCTYAIVGGLTMARLNRTDVGSPFIYFEPKKFTVANFRPYYTNGMLKDKLYHPVKLKS